MWCLGGVAYVRRVLVHRVAVAPSVAVACVSWTVPYQGRRQAAVAVMAGSQC